MIPYARQSIDDDDIAAVVAVLRSDHLTQGPAVAAFEHALAALTGARHAIAVSSGTAALHLACLAYGLAPGKRLWTSANTFVASANCGRYCGATVELVDIDAETLNLSIPVLAARLEEAAARGGLPDVVVAVDFAGLPCDYEALAELARQYRFTLIEDAAHALGARHRQRMVGALPGVDATIFSFHPAKIVTAAEGGAVLTDDDDIALRIRELRQHGITRDPSRMPQVPDGAWRYDQIALGFNYRLSDIHAALGTSQLRRLEHFLERRRRLAQRYDARLAALPVTLPPRQPHASSAWHLYPVRLRRGGGYRKAVFDAMRAADIGVNVHYIPVHYQESYRSLGFQRGQFPEAERYYDAALTLPLFADLTDDQQDDVINRFTDSVRRAESLA
jgi:UDP-4-amino-4,6-dideoxy-N-acetyl-beta-L-altrosamine transaminase